MASLNEEELKKAAIHGDVTFLNKCVESNKPFQFYHTFYPKEEGKRKHFGNILHIAVKENQEEFVREVIKMLPLEDIQQLLLLVDGSSLWNPLHIAASVGNLEMVKIILDVYRTSLPSDLTKRPWLQKVHDGYATPCHVALSYDNEDCALEIFKMDRELLANMPFNDDDSLICDALMRKFTKFSLEILKSPNSINCSGSKGDNPFHSLRYLDYSEEAEEICRQLLQRVPELIKQADDNTSTPFHWWASDGKLWAFKCLLESKDINNKEFIDMVNQTNRYGDNTLHNLAEICPSEEAAIKIAELLISVYKQQQEAPNISEDQFPWLVVNNYGDTPLSLAIAYKKKDFALYMLQVDENVVIKGEKNVMFLAIENGCHEVAEKILEIVDNNGWNHILTNHHQQSVLHLAPLCTENFCKKLMVRHPDLLFKKDSRRGNTILHEWMSNNKVWPIEYILNTKWRSSFIKLMKYRDYIQQNNPVHAAAMTKYKEMDQAVKLLVNAFKEEFSNWSANDVDQHPWFEKNEEGEGPLHLAICNRRENLALYFLSLQTDRIETLLDNYEPECSTLFLAMKNNCSGVVKQIMERLHEDSWTKYLKNPSNGQNILHLAPNFPDEKRGRWLVNKAPIEFITEDDIDEQSPWDKAFEVDSAWFIKACLKKDPLVFSKKPLAWIKACKNGHVSALRASIDHNPGAFRDLCIEYKESPLHHIQGLPNSMEYEKFLKIPRMKDLINVQDSNGETPLHKAIRNEDIYLTELLLSMKKILDNIQDKKNETAMGLLAHEYNQNKERWVHMCKRNGIDPTVTYFQRKTDTLEVRASLFVVAALLATITFTAGFTLPGGFNQDTGEALLAKKAAFLVFLVSDSLALFFSMLVLIYFTWSLVYNTSDSLKMLGRSMKLLRVAFICTLLAFMTGVYIVIAPKSLWAAILIIVIISFLILISVNNNVLKGVMDKVFSFAEKKLGDPMHLAELGYISKQE